MPLVERRKILIICDVFNEKAVLINNKLSELIVICGKDKADVASNVREMTKIGQEGITEWLLNKLSISDVSIFLMHNKNNKQNSSHVSIALGLVGRMFIKDCDKLTGTKIIAAHCDTFATPETFMKGECSQTLYLQKDLGKMLKLIFGCDFRKNQNYRDSKMSLLKLLSSEESIEGESEQLNDLSNTQVIETNREESLNILNVVNQDELPSIECNT